MDNSFRTFGFSTNFSNVFGDLVKFQNGSVYRTATILNLDSHGINDSIFNGIKRKWDAVGGEGDPKYVSSLVLGIGYSPSSSDDSKVSSAICTLSSAKETDESSNDLGLNFHFHFGNESTPSPKRPAMAAPKALVREPVCDLQLSLSMGPSQSVITSTSPVSAQRQDGVEASVTIGTTSLDDESSSSHWKPEGSSLLPFNFIDANDTSFMHMLMKKAESQLLSASALMPKRPVTCSSGLAQQRTTNTKICKFQGCGKGARGASGLCIAHGGGRRCQREGCNKGAEGRTVYCKAHGGGRRCQFLGCTKSAEGRTEYLAAQRVLKVAPEVAKGVRRRTAPRVQKVILASAFHMEAGDVVNSLLVQKVHKGALCSAKHMVVARDALLWAAPREQKEVRPSVRAMAEGSAAHSKVALSVQRVSMVGHGSVLLMGVARDVLNLNALRVQEGGPISVSVMAEANGASLKVVERVHRGALIFVRPMVAGSGARGDRQGPTLALVSLHVTDLLGLKLASVQHTLRWFQIAVFMMGAHWDVLFPSICSTVTVKRQKTLPMRMMPFKSQVRMVRKLLAGMLFAHTRI